MERQKALTGLILLASMSFLTNACNDDADAIDATGGAPTAGKGSGGSSGKGGKAGSDGGGTGGDAGSDGSGGKGMSGSSGSSSGTGATGGGGSGGEAGMSMGGEGGEPTAGSSGASGSSGAGAGGTSGGGSGGGGTSGGGNGGSGGAPPEYCYDHLFVPLGAVGDQADFEIQYPTTIDLSATVITVRLRADQLGNGGGLQVYLKNGEAQSYASAYLGWNSLSSLTEWTTLTYDIAALTPASESFDKTAVQWVGINVTTGSDFSGAVWDDVDVYVDSITFSDGASTDLDFNSGVPVLSVNPYNTPVAGSAVSPGVCEEDPGSGGTGGGGAGGTGGSAGSAGAAGAGTGGGGAGGSDATGGFAGDMGMAGEAGMPGAGGDPGAGGSDPTGGTAGTAGTGGGPTNLIQNGDFEGGTADWWYSWGTGTFQTSSTAHSGSYSLLVTGRTGENLNIVQTITPVVSVGNTYAVSAYARTSAATTGHFTAQIDCAVATDVYQWIQGPQDMNDTGWTSLTGTLDMTDPCLGDAITAVNLYLEGMGEGIDVYLDDVVMTEN